MLPALIGLAGSAMNAAGQASAGPKVSSANAANNLGLTFDNTFNVTTGSGSASSSKSTNGALDWKTLAIIAGIGYFLWKKR